MADGDEQTRFDRLLTDARARVTEAAADVVGAVERVIDERMRGGADGEDDEREVPEEERDPLEIFSDARRREVEQLGHANILVVGQTGVGKSTLINAVFRKPLAAAGMGRPVTKVVQRFEDPDVPVTLYDTRGVELGDEQKAVIRDFRKIIEKSLKGPPEEHIHLVWYCMDAGQTRVQHYDDAIISSLAEHVPVVLVLTQAIDDERADALEKAVLEAGLDITGGRAIRTLAAKRRIRGTTLRPHGLDDLVRVTDELLPEAVRRAFTNAQGVLLELKANQARAIVGVASAAAAGVGAAPIKGPDALVLRPIQVGMLAGVTAVFGIEFDAETRNKLVAAATGQGGVEKLGKKAVKLLLRRTPGVGQAVNATVAGVLTAALGEAFVRLCSEYLRREADGRTMPVDQVVEFLLDIYGALLRGQTRAGLPQTPNQAGTTRVDGQTDTSAPRKKRTTGASSTTRASRSPNRADSSAGRRASKTKRSEREGGSSTTRATSGRKARPAGAGSRAVKKRS